jgi:uncharacterized membrane protein YjjP (DUF1212 family)
VILAFLFGIAIHMLVVMWARYGRPGFFLAYCASLQLAFSI